MSAMAFEEIWWAIADTRFGRLLRCYNELPSTNDFAAALAREGAPDGTVILAAAQTQGRGSRGRGWFSPPGGLYLSVVLRPRLDPGAALGLTLAAGVASAEAVMACEPVEVSLKWPNDLQLAGRKLGGVLVETAAVPGRVRHAVVGIGINANIAPEAFPPELQPVATSLQEHLGRPVDLKPLLRELLERLDAANQALEQGQLAQIVERWRALDGLAGSRVTVVAGEGRIEGDYLGIDDEGALLLRDRAGEVRRFTSRSTIEILVRRSLGEGGEAAP
jgi:BirA family biotin operon repressor/biotin-[acetyl-CoA-carboxylase] ligase